MPSPILDYIADIFYPPKCFSCNTLLPLGCGNALCPDCLDKWIEEKKTLCPGCGRAHYRCECIPKYLVGSVNRTIHLTRYPKWDSTARRLILTAKNNPYTYLFRFFASEIAKSLRERVDITSDTVICYAPRDPKKIRKYGVDQAKSTAVLLGKELALPVLNAFIRGKASEQKALNVQGRLLNANKAYTIKEGVKEQLAGKTVILYDDVLTTGATVLALSRLLRKAGAQAVIVVTIAKTVKEKQEKQGSSGKEPDNSGDEFDFEEEFGDILPGIFGRKE